MTRDDVTLWDMARAARLASDFVGRVADVGELEDDLLVQSAVIYQPLVIGEAAKRLSNDVRTSHPDVPWSEMARMRDRLIHGYDDVDLGLVWETATVDVPELLVQIEPLLPQF